LKTANVNLPFLPPPPPPCALFGGKENIIVSSIFPLFSFFFL
jgi:hypothetical protein